jgi:hypothetical protein
MMHEIINAGICTAKAKPDEYNFVQIYRRRNRRKGKVDLGSRCLQTSHVIC